MAHGSEIPGHKGLGQLDSPEGYAPEEPAACVCHFQVA